MEPTAAVFLVVDVLALLLLPRRWAALPLLAGACFVTRAPAIDIGGATFTVLLLLVLAGMARVAIRREWIAGGANQLDAVMMAWGVWTVASGAFHSHPAVPLVLRVRTLYEAWGLYLLFRVFCRSRDDLRFLAGMLALILVPVAAEMVAERLTGTNFFGRFGGVPALSAVRNGVVRSQGPFAHSILAGSVGAVCLPLTVGLWHRQPARSIIGISACAAMVITSGSSGPLLSTAAGLGALLLWPLRGRMWLVRWTATAIYVSLAAVMNRPAYFLMSDIDLVGGSTSWYRAELIRSAFAHFDEWWLVGTDYTRHWMWTGLAADPNQVDITNHYLAMGVLGGALLMSLFIWMFVTGFQNVGTAIRSDATDKNMFLCWAVGASLFAHAVTCVSVSYFDASVMFLYLTFAATTAALYNGSGLAPVAVQQSACTPARTSWIRRAPRRVGEVGLAQLRAGTSTGYVRRAPASRPERPGARWRLRP